MGKTKPSDGARHSQGEIATFYKGDIDEIRLYNRALTDDEIKYLAEHFFK